MKKYLDIEVFKTVTKIADDENVICFVIGGFVRDILLQRPSKDIDIVILGNGIELAKKVAKQLGGLHVSIFKNFGTAMLKYRDIEVEFVGARKESYDRNSRKPVVENGTLEDDQNRRDFTINALAISLNSKDYGQLVDPFGGIQDLKRGIIKTPLDPQITFSDDPLRMLRAIRFASQLDFTIEENTFKAICQNVNRLQIVSKERIIGELNKIILSPVPSKGFKLMHESGLLKVLIPELSDLEGVENIEGIAHKNNLYHSFQVLDNISSHSNNLWLRWAALLHDIGKTRTKKFDKNLGWTFHGHEIVGERMIEKLFRRMKFPLNENMKYVQKLVLLHLRPIALVEDVVTDSAIRRLLFDAGDQIDDLMALCEADITSKNEKRVRRYLDNFQLVRQKLVTVEEKDAVRNFQPPVTGEVIMDTFKIGPSKEIGIIKNTIKEAILDGTIHNDFNQAYALMLKTAKELGLKQIKGPQEY